MFLRSILWLWHNFKKSLCIMRKCGPRKNQRRAFLSSAAAPLPPCSLATSNLQSSSSFPLSRQIGGPVHASKSTTDFSIVPHHGIAVKNVTLAARSLNIWIFPWTHWCFGCYSYRQGSGEVIWHPLYRSSNGDVLTFFILVIDAMDVTLSVKEAMRMSIILYTGHWWYGC